MARQAREKCEGNIYHVMLRGVRIMAFGIKLLVIA